jgi:hypothetical protein
MKLSYSERQEQRRLAELRLTENLIANKQSLEKLLASCNDHWGYEDPIYRFYHQSFKVFIVQESTEEIVSALRSLLPEQPINEWFEKIIEDGISRTFTDQTNENWLAETRPVLEAFFHAKYFLEMAVRYAGKFEEPSTILPSGWASLLYLYGLR